MKTNRILAFAALIAGSALAQAQNNVMPGLTRTDVMRHDVSVDGREVIQVRVGFERGSAAPYHSHPGEEIAYVLEGTLEYQFEGQQPTILKAGDALFIPAGTNHSAKNVGSGKAIELATYFVDKTKPLVVPAK
jgi:quercetin dioxygenase-like cupin family protein